MPYKPINISAPREMKPISIDKFKGIDYTNNKKFEYSPDSKNCVLDEEYTPEKRPGYVRVFSDILGATKINGIHLYKQKAGEKHRLIHQGTKLYKVTTSLASTIDVVAHPPSELSSSMANAPSFSFMMNDKLYIKDGTNYLQYDGTNIVDVSTVAKIPEITLGRNPAGTAGTPNEPINLLTPWVIDSFSGTGAATTFKLSYETIDVAAITISVDAGVTYGKLETTNFTVNRTTGVVTVSVAAEYPTGTDNIKVKYAKTFAGNADTIKKCTIISIFYSRVFLSGNPDFPNYDYMSEVLDPTYFTEDGWNKFGVEANPIMSYDIQYNVQVIVKATSEQDRTLYRRLPNNINPEITPFLTEEMNSKIGSVAKRSNQLIKNKSTWLSETGIQWLVSTNVAEEKNIEHISERIDKSNLNTNLGLLRESNLENAISIDFNSQYILAINDNCYVYDYVKDAWHYWTNIPASCFLIDDNKLYFGSNKDGQVYRFKTKDEHGCYNDDGAAIDSHWYGIMTAICYENYTKIIPSLNYSIKPWVRTSVTFGYVTEEEYVNNFQVDRMDLFDFEDIDFENFTFETNNNPKSIPVHLRLRGITYFQPLFSNNVIDEGFGFTNIIINWDLQNEVR